MGVERLLRMTWKDWALISLPCGVITSGDVGLSNLSMVTLTMSFYTMVKASTPIFVVTWAYLFGIERITWNLLGVICVIVLGELLSVKGEVKFEMKGFLLCLAASVLSGARWTLVQLKLQTMDPPLKTTIATMRLLAPSMFASLLVASVAIERPWMNLSARSFEYNLEVFCLGMLGASLAIAMILCEFYLIMHSSAIVLMIGGVIKELVTIFLGVTIYDDKLNPINIMGCATIFVGVILYKIIFHLERNEPDLHRRPEHYQQVYPEEAAVQDGTEEESHLEIDDIITTLDPVAGGVEMRRPPLDIQ